MDDDKPSFEYNVAISFRTLDLGLAEQLKALLEQDPARAWRLIGNRRLHTKEQPVAVLVIADSGGVDLVRTEKVSRHVCSAPCSPKIPRKFAASDGYLIGLSCTDRTL